MRKLLIIGIGSLCFLFLSACSSNEYDESIDEVIKIQNKALDEEGVKTDIDTLKREDTGIKVYEDGEYIEIFYEIKKGKNVDKLFKKKNNSYEYVVEDMEGKEPVYTENIDE